MHLVLLLVLSGSVALASAGTEESDVLLTFHAFIKPPVVSTEAFFGQAVAISGDRAIIGSPGEDSSIAGIVMNPTGSEPALTDTNASGSGAAYILERDPSNGAWRVEAFVKAPAVSSGDYFGGQVSISGDHAVVGARGEDSSVSGIVVNPTGSETALLDAGAPNSGAAYIFERNPATRIWAVTAFVKAPAVSIESYFGDSVSVSGDRAVVGAPFEDSGVPGIVMNPTGSEPSLTNGNAPHSGAVYILERSFLTGTWTVVAFVKAPAVGTNEYFGASVSVSDGLAIIGAAFEDSNVSGIVMNPSGREHALTDGNAPNSGAAYILGRNDTTGAWSVAAFVKAPVVSEGVRMPGDSYVPQDFFGASVAIDGARAIIGAPREDSGVPGIVMNPTGTELPLRDSSVRNSGAAYILEHNNETGVWFVAAFVKAPAVSDFDWFGWSVQISGERAIVGALYEDSSVPGVVMNPKGSEPSLTNGTYASRSGAAYILQRNSSTAVWSVVAFIKPPVVSREAEFGRSVAIDGDNALVGARYEASGTPGIVMNPTGTEAALANKEKFRSGASYLLSFSTTDISTTGTTGTTAERTAGTTGIAGIPAVSASSAESEGALSVGGVLAVLLGAVFCLLVAGSIALAASKDHEPATSSTDHESPTSSKI
jgi:FG-GAP repeat